MSDKTTSEQLAEIDRDMADIERQVAELVEEAQQADYPQPEPVQVREGRWRTRSGDIRNVTPRPEGDGRKERYPWWDAQWHGTWTADGRYNLGAEGPLDLVEYLGPIEEQPQPQPIQVREGRWRTRAGEIVSVSAMPTDDDNFSDAYPWWDGDVATWANNGVFFSAHTADKDLVEYLGPIEPDKTQELPQYTPPEGWRVVRFGELLQPGDMLVNEDGTEQRSAILHWDAAAVSGGRCIRRIGPQPQPQPEPQAATIEELRSEVSYVQRLLGESRQRVTQLEELVGSLRTINVAQEKAFTAAGKENTALRNQLAAVKAELASVAADRYRLQIELDAAQQVPADSPELRQLRADLEQMTLCADTYRDGYNRVLSDLETIRETTKAETVEAIAEWLVPVQAAIAAADNVAESTRAGWLAEEVIQHLPKIMRSLVGLDSPEDVD